MAQFFGEVGGEAGIVIGDDFSGGTIVRKDVLDV